MTKSYHHGDLRRAVLARAVRVIETEGPEQLSLRSLAADLGVSHTAPRHHFGSREGVLSAVAAEGFGLLADTLRTVRESGGSFLDTGVAYVRFASEHPAHFEVMFSPKLLDQSDPALQAAREVTFAELRVGVQALEDAGQVDDAPAAVLAAWSVVHGIATLALTGNLDASELRSHVANGDLLAITRRSTAMLFSGPGSVKA